MLTIFVGSADIAVTEAAKKHDKSAYLVDFNNCDIIHQGTIYTSIADLPNLPTFARLLSAADTIIYVPPPSWTTNQKIKNYSEQYWTEHYLTAFLLDKNKTVINFDFPNFNKSDNITKLQDHRQSDNRQLWMVGCSITYGLGVLPHERYGNILGDKLNLSVSNLSLPGASILWAAYQILRSDIRKDDLVVWGLTDVTRFPYYNLKSNTVVPINLANYTAHKELFSTKFMLDFNLVYLAINNIWAVKNFCDKMGAKLVLAGVLTGVEFALYLKDFPEYVHLGNYWGVETGDQFLDVGSDIEKHPGPKTHEWYAKKVLEHLGE